MYSFLIPHSDLDWPPYCSEFVVGGVYALFREDTIILPGSHKGLPEKITLEQSRSSEFQAQLVRDDLFIPLGRLNNNLCAIRFETNVQLKAFLSANPAQSTLVTQLGDAFTIWYQVNGEKPTNVRLPTCEWLSSGAIQLVDRSVAVDKCCFSSVTPPRSVNFPDLNWTIEDNKAFRLARQEELYGPQFIKGKPNVVHFALAYAEDAQMWYDPAKSLFWSDLTGSVLTYSKYQLVEAILALITTCPPELGLSGLVNKSALNEIIRLIRLKRAKLLPGLSDDLRKFFAATCQPAKGRNVTVSELIKYFSDWFLACTGNHAHLPVIQAQIRPLVFELYQITCSKSILRNNKHQNGFRGLVYRQDQRKQDLNGTLGVSGVVGVAENLEFQSE
jgi:hypothetical protein